MIPRNQSRMNRRHQTIRNRVLGFFLMFITFSFWTGYMILGSEENLWHPSENLLVAQLPVGSENWHVGADGPKIGLWEGFGQVAFQSLLGIRTSGQALPWVGQELLWIQNGVQTLPDARVASTPGQQPSWQTNPRADQNKPLEEDYTLLADPYAARWPEYPKENLLILPEGTPRLLIYHTHNSESYLGDDSSKAGVSGVIAAGRVLGQALESQYGIKIAHSEAMNDRPDFTKAYMNSFNVASTFLRKYPNLETLIDLHRDGGLSKREDTLVTIQGRPCARLLLVMGNSYAGFQGNLAFAQKLQAKADELYPGLMKPIRIADKRRYNQQLHPKAILLEVGSDLNTQTDAENSMTLFAHVLGQVLEEK